jgi:hypothetical protein
MAEVSIRLSVRSSADDSLVTHGGRENDNIVCEQRQYEITRHLPLLGTKILFFFCLAAPLTWFSRARAVSTYRSLNRDNENEGAIAALGLLG